MKTCEYLDACGFYAKYQNSSHIDCRGFIASYCKGTKMHECARLEYLKRHNLPPSDDMLPSGKIIEYKKPYEPYKTNNQQFF